MSLGKVGWDQEIEMSRKRRPNDSQMFWIGLSFVILSILAIYGLATM